MDFRSQRPFTKPILPMEISDRSTECESPSPDHQSEHKIPDNPFGILKCNTKIKSCSFHDVTRTSSLNNLKSGGDTFQPKSFGKPMHKGSFESNRNLEAIRQRVKGSLFGNVRKEERKPVSLQLAQEDQSLELPLQPISAIDRTISLSDESPLSQSPRREEERKMSLVSLVLEDKIPVSESEISPNNEKSQVDQQQQNKMQSVFLLDVDREMNSLKEELKIEDDENIFVINGNFASYYQTGELLGEGTTGTVKKCKRVGTSESFAVKTVSYKNDIELLVLIVKEFKNHLKLSHRNIIKVYELYIDVFNRKIHTIMELSECREMFEVIINMGHYSEAIASHIFKQILAGINYLHLNGVCHRDLKPNNILVSQDGKTVKITDFNVSKFVENKSKKYSPHSTSNYKMWTYTGTIAFTAPEVFKDVEYTEAVDMWSAGTVLYTMLCGYQPFQAEFTNDLIEMIKEAKFDLNEESWRSISEEAKNLVRCCLDPDYRTRFLPAQALLHPWIMNSGKVPDTSISKARDNLAFSVIQTRPRGDSSSKLTFKCSPLIWENKARLSLPRRMSACFHSVDFEFSKKVKDEKTPAKRPSKIIMPFDTDFVELNIEEEDCSPELKKFNKTRRSIQEFEEANQVFLFGRLAETRNFQAATEIIKVEYGSEEDDPANSSEEEDANK